MTKEIVALYARVSSDEQRDAGSINTQLEYARGRANLEGWSLREFTDDGLSGTIPFTNRPGGRALLDAARTGDFSLVVSYRLDRLGRTQRVVLDAIDGLKAAGVHYRSLTEAFEVGTPFGDAALGMTSVFAQLELNTLKQRMRDGKERVATHKDHRMTGAIPYGYEGIDQGRDKLIVVSPREAEVVRLIFARCIEGWSHRRIAAELNDRGVPTHSDAPGKRKKLLDKRGRRSKLSSWERPAVTRILHSELYTGRASFFKGSTTTAVTYRDVPPIIDAATFLKSREAVARQQQFGGSRTSKKHDYWLRGLVRCHLCNHLIAARAWRTRHGYYCRNCPNGQRAFVPEDRILSVLWTDVLEFLSNPDQTLRALARSATEAGITEDRIERELMALAQRGRELDFQESQLVDMRLSKTITPSIYDGKFKVLAAERKHLDLLRQAVRDERAAASRQIEETETARRLLGSLREIAERKGTDPATRARIVRAVTRSVVVHVAAARRPRLIVSYAFGRSAVAASRESTSSWTDGTNLS
jgi:site-specific DNA recombinase